jgi:hypothetical protein
MASESADKKSDTYTLEEVSYHHTADDCWVIYKQKVIPSYHLALKDWFDTASVCC